MSKKKVVIIAVIIGLIALGLIVVLKIKITGGTPIIIKGSSAGGKYVEISGDIPATHDKDHTAKGEYTYIKVTGASGKCVVYRFPKYTWTPFKVHLETETETEPSVDEVSVSDQWLDNNGVEFDEVNRFDNPTNGYFKSKVPRKVTHLSVDVPSSNCIGPAGPLPTCPSEFPNPNWLSLEDLYVAISEGESCQ